MSDQLKSYPVNSIKRMPSYLRLVRALDARGERLVSSSHIASELGLDPIQVRKDIQLTGMIGRPKLGYATHELATSIERFLGWNDTSLAFLVGAGSLGSAVLGYSSFKTYGLDIAVAFDRDPARIGRTIHGKEVLSVDKLPDLAQRMHPHIGIITVPAAAAQEVAELLYYGGLRAIWNFAPVTLSMPASVVVENVHLSASLAVLTARMKGLQQSNA